MAISVVALPLLLIMLALFVVAIILIIKAFTGKNNRAGKAIAGTLIAVGVLILVPILLVSLLFVTRVSTHTTVIHQQNAQVQAMEAVERARFQTELAKQRTREIAETIEAKANEIRNRTSVQLDRVIAVPMPAAQPGVSLPSVEQVFGSTVVNYEDPATMTAQAVPMVVVEAPAVEEYFDPVLTTQNHSAVTVAGTPWTNAVEEHQDFEADVYPSLEAAAEALGRRVGQRLMQGLADSEAEASESPYIYVWRDDADGGDVAIITRDVLEAVARGLKQKMFDPAYVSVERPVSGIAVRVAIQDIKFDSHNRWREHAESRSGGLALRVTGDDSPFSLSTRFIEAPWLVDRTSFTHDYANGDWLIAYSDGTHSTHEEARQDALSIAAESVLPLARGRINQMSGSDQNRFHQQMAKNPNWLRDRVADELRTRNMATDQFTQQFVRPYGSVWREAVLVDAAPQRIEQIARSLVQGINVQVTHQRTTWFSYIALVVLVIGTYLFLNMATKGYYAWSLRAALIIGLVVAGLVVLNLA